MPNNTPSIAKRYYPKLSEIVTLESLPEFLSFVQDGLNEIFDKIHYKNLQYSKSYRGDGAFYSLDIVSREKIGLSLPGGLMLVLNPDASDSSISSFPVMVEYQWEILGFLRSFNLQNFSFTIQEFYTTGLQVFRISESEVVANSLNFFTEPASASVTNYQQLEADINAAFPGANFTLPENPNVNNITAAITENTQLGSVPEVLFVTYIENADVDVAGMNLHQFFTIVVPEGIEAYIKRIITPKARAAFALSAGLEFPREYLQPVYGPNGENPFGAPDPSQALEIIPATDLEGNPKVTLLFGQANFYADTEKGLGYQLQLALQTNVYGQIGNTGLVVYLDNLKIDLSKETNIPEADADGRPADFIGVAADQVGLILPKKWFSAIQEDTTLQVVARRLVIGTGGFSGTISLETIDTGNPPAENDVLWVNIGSADGFKVGFTKFDITFRQSKVVHSLIAGSLEINRFVYPGTDTPVRINVLGEIMEDGDFALTASAVPPYPIEFKDVFTYSLKSVSIGEQDDKFYIGTSGTLQFEGILRNVLKLGPIEIDRLLIYSDGSMEFSGGSINLIEPIVLPLGPADITVTAIHYGSHQKEVNGVMRKFNYFGFDGGINVDPLGVEVRGDGVKYYYCTDNLPNKPQSYLHIQTLYLDLTIPADSPVAIINGWLSIPEPGTSPEYSGGIKIQLPKVKITGSADMRLAPKYPAFIIDASIEFPAPIPLGTFAIYGFRGLLGYRYVAEKEAIGLVSGVDTWYDYYKFPPRGIHVTKFSGPNQTENAEDAYSIGAGASLGTSFDNGTVLNIKAMILLSVPSSFIIDGRASILSARLGLENTQDPPFFAFLAIGDNSVEFGFGADFKMPTSNGSILKLYADIQAAFFFNNPSKWYVNIGTKDNPVTAEILQLVTLKSYLMLSAKGIEAGTRGEFDFRRTYAGIIKVHAWAYIEIGGKISFEKPQFGAYLDAGVGADIDVKFVELYASFQILFAVEASKPYLIYGKVRLKIKIKILWVFKFSFDQEVEVLWEKSKNVDRAPINPLINASNTAAIPQLVKGVNMLNNETFELAYLGGDIPSSLNTQITQHIIPLDTYIDIKTEKAILPGAVGHLIGGVTNPPANYTDLVPPDKVVKGKELRQVKHQYSLESLVIKSWRPAAQGTAAGWDDYHPYKALYPDDQTPAFDNLKIGQFQKSDGRYNTVRLLATTPFSYTEQGEPGWYVPEQYGITPGTLFCEGEQLEPQCADFLQKPLDQRYYFFDGNHMIYANEAAFLILNTDDDDFAEVTDHPNIFEFAQSLAFPNRKPMQAILPKPSVYISLKLTSDSQGVRVKYYAPLINDLALEVQYGNPDPDAVEQYEPHTVLLSTSQLTEAVIYDRPTWRPVTKIIIEPIYPNPLLLGSLELQIAAINNLNDQIALGLAAGAPQSPNSVINELDQIASQAGSFALQSLLFDPSNNVYTAGSAAPIPAWDFTTGHKVKENRFGFMLAGNNLTIESDNQIIGVKLFPKFPVRNYVLHNDGKKATIFTDNIKDFIKPGEVITLEIDVFEEECAKDNILCGLHEAMLDTYTTCLISPDVIKEEELKSVAACVKYLRELIYQFNDQNPSYFLLEEYSSNIQAMDTFLKDNTLQNYWIAHGAISKIITGIDTIGNCDCGCEEETNLCELHEEILPIYNDCLKNPSDISKEDLQDLVKCMETYMSLLFNFEQQYPEYNIIKGNYELIKEIDNFLSDSTLESYQAAYQAATGITEAISTEGNCDCSNGGGIKSLEDLFNAISDLYNSCFPEVNQLYNFTTQVGCAQDIIDYLNHFDTANPGYGIIKDLQEYIDMLEDFIINPGAGTYNTAIGAIEAILDYLNELGHYAFDKIPRTTLLHQICWLSKEDYQYNINIPGQAAIAADTQATIDGITKYIQPVWRPDTSYVIQFVLKDTVDEGENQQLYPFTYGFTTAGPVGYFHTHPQSDYGGNQISVNPDAFALTSLRQYIDYERSYPNADGNLLSAKPLFYDDETTQVYLFFTKSYATHFFHSWQAYNGKEGINGRLKVVIKDPTEGTEIVNPPYLDYDENDITTINIPQTVEEWRRDEEPLIPFVVSQWANLYMANNCISTGGDSIRPASQFITIALKHLKPSKLYTAIVNNLYDTDGDGEFNEANETREVHKFVFKTSRYATFADQINSYLLTKGSGADYVSKEAIFSVTKDLTALQIDMAYKTIIGESNPADALIEKYQHAFDRVLEGVLAIEPLDEAVSTEFNFIRTVADNKIIAVIIRNPEPFNIPKIPISEITDTIQVMDGSVADPNYKVLFSKDYSQAILMHVSQIITAPSLSFKFRYKVWDGYSYAESGSVPPVTIDVL